MTERMKLLVTFGLYAADIVISTLFFILLFHLPLFSKLNVFFYRGVIFLFIASFFAVALLILTAHFIKKIDLNTKDFFVIFFLFFGFTLAWFVLIPTTVERSITVFMLSYMDQNDQQGLTSKEFGDIFYQKYIDDFGAFDKRFSEQVTSKNMKLADEGDGYVITGNGRVIVNMFRLCSKLFNTEQWLVYPNDYEKGYKKDLTNE